MKKSMIAMLLLLMMSFVACGGASNDGINYESPNFTNPEAPVVFTDPKAPSMADPWTGQSVLPEGAIMIDPLTGQVFYEEDFVRIQMNPLTGELFREEIDSFSPYGGGMGFMISLDDYHLYLVGRGLVVDELAQDSSDTD
jgi:hypothetical protein